MISTGVTDVQFCTGSAFEIGVFLTRKRPHRLSTARMHISRTPHPTDAQLVSVFVKLCAVRKHVEAPRKCHDPVACASRSSQPSLSGEDTHAVITQSRLASNDLV